MSKKFLYGFILVFVILQITNFIVHELILSSVYESDELKSMWRPDMESKMWIMWLTGLIFSFFYVLIFTKYTRGKGFGEGLLFGLFSGLMLAIPMAYNSYATWPLPYSVAFQWFIYGLIQYLIVGSILGIIFKETPKEVTREATE